MQWGRKQSVICRLCYYCAEGGYQFKYSLTTMVRGVVGVRVEGYGVPPLLGADQFIGYLLLLKLGIHLKHYITYPNQKKSILWSVLP